MTQLELIFSIETKRDLAINARNLLVMKIQEEGSGYNKQKQLCRLQGQIEAYNSMLDEIRISMISETLKEWKANA